ncbi:MAG: TraR/DksA C4-type zinc finger protein [Gemmatimonadales bacterium]|jgi:RNA polymerase-binding protein DksA
MPLSKKDRAHFEQRLLDEREKIVRQLAQFDESFSDTLQGSDGDLSAYSFHMADQGTDAMEREKAFLFASKEGRLLYHIDEALRRLYKTPDRYGVCQECGGDVGYERLDALPHARLCIRCKEREEDGGA